MHMMYIMIFCIMSNSKLPTILLLGMLVCNNNERSECGYIVTVKQFENQADYSLHLDFVRLRYLV